MRDIVFYYDRTIVEAFERAQELCDREGIKKIETLFIVRELLKDGESKLYEYFQEVMPCSDEFVEKTLDVCINDLVEDIKKKQENGSNTQDNDSEPQDNGSNSTDADVNEEDEDNFIEIPCFEGGNQQFAKYHISDDLADVFDEMLEYSEDMVEEAIDNNPYQIDDGKVISIMITANLLMNYIIYFMPKDMTKFLRKLEIKVSDVKNALVGNSNVMLQTDVDQTKTLPFLIDVTADCKEGIPNPICGRDKEATKIWEIISKMNKRNAILVGEPGVGKTAIIQKIAQDITNGDCPERFKNYRVMSLDITGLIAGTSLRGQAEEKFKQLNSYLESNDNVILFIDEMHTMMGAGACKEGEMDLANSMKPILARGKAIVIGATTNDEYEKYFSRDGALKRRFEKVEIREPKTEEIYSMLKVKIKELTKFHGVRITAKMVEFVAFTASCMQNETRNPDRTLDLIDRSMVIAKNAGKTSVDRESVIANYNMNFERFEKMNPAEKRSTAYHEAGHWLVHELSGRLNDYTAMAISIIPADNYLGITVYEESDITVNKTMNYYIDYLAMDLAGRKAEELIGNEENAGVSSDLKSATETAYRVVTKFGMVDGFSISYSKDMVTEETSERINQAVKELLLKAEKRAEELLVSNRALLDAVAKLVLEKKMVSKKDLDRLLAKYTKQSDEE